MRLQNPEKLTSILRPIGFALLILVGLDAIASIIPPNFFSSTWEFNTIGNMVSRIPLILLGFGTVFYTSQDIKTQKDRILWLSCRWLALIIAILFVLMTPLLLINSSRIKSQTDVKISSEVTQRLAGLDKLEAQVKQGNPVDLKNNLLQVSPRIDLNNRTPEEIKKQLLLEITAGKQNARQTVEKRWESNRIELVKNTVKWFLGSIIGATLLFWIWRVTA